jgi:Grx4 family monothiol glutaredoxin
MSNNKLVDITSAAALNGDKPKAVLLFGASWHEACAPLEAVLSALTTTATDVLFGKVDAEQVTELTDKYQVEAVPTILFMTNGGTTVTERLEGGVDPAQVTVAVQRLLSTTTTTTTVSSVAAAPEAMTTTTTVDPETALNQRLDQLVKSDTVMLFMKGNPTAPRCGFSRQAIELLQQQDVAFGSFDIMSDDAVRQGLKKFGNWPTYPQIYVNGDLVGGLDILKELAEDGPLKDQWNLSEASSASSSLNDRLTKLVKRNDVMIFMKGLPSAPQCGFSRQLVEILDGTGVAYDSFNILEDEEVRQGLKEFSNWPTYPQVYVKGDLMGGLDIVQELQESDELMDMLNQ